jgi:hypothetical protein
LPPTPQPSEDGGDLAGKALGLLKSSPALGIVAITGLVAIGIVGIVALGLSGGGRSED